MTAYRDTVHGFIAQAKSKTGAWKLIRARCRAEGLEAPTKDKMQRMESIKWELIAAEPYHREDEVWTTKNKHK